MCIHYRHLNNVSVKNRNSLPTIDDFFDQLQVFSFFSKIDLRSGYHQHMVRDEDVPKIAFHNGYGNYKFLVMPFGLTNAPAAFMEVMNKVFLEYLDSFIIVFIDDIFIYSKIKEEHEQHLRLILHVLRQHQFYAKISKCVFWLRLVTFRGQVVFDKGVEVDLRKTEGFKNWPKDLIPIDIHSFLGLSCYYRMFMEVFSSIAASLTTWTMKKAKFEWTEAF